MKITFNGYDYKKINDVFKANYKKVKKWDEMFALLPEQKLIRDNPVIMGYLMTQFFNKKQTQPGFLTESLLIKDFANGLGMKQTIITNEENQEKYKPRAEYSDGKGNYVLQLGQPDQTDCLLIKNGQLTWIEIKEPNAKFGETALIQSNDGKLAIRTQKNYDKWAFYQPIIDDFNKKYNAWDFEEKSLLFTPEIDASMNFLKKYLGHKHIDKIMTWNDQGDIVFYSMPDIRKHLEAGDIVITGEIRTGKDNIGWKQMTAKDILSKHLKEQKAVIIDGKVEMPFDSDKQDGNRYKISGAFFVYIKKSNRANKNYEYAVIENNKIKFPLTSVIQIPDLISFRIKFLK